MKNENNSAQSKRKTNVEIKHHTDDIIKFLQMSKFQILGRITPRK